MKKSYFLTFIGVAAAGLLLAGGVAPALASDSLTFFSDNQTYIISGTDTPGNTTATCSYGTCNYSDTSFYGKGAMEISATVSDPGVNKNVPRAMDSLFSFDTGSAKSGTAGGSSYYPGAYPPTSSSSNIGMDVAGSFNTQYGTGNWHITGVSIILASNWQGQGVQPSNPDFNVVNAGLFTFDVLGANPGFKAGSTAAGGTTWNYIQNTFLPGTTASSVGTFQWTPWAAGTTDNSEEPQWTYNLTVTPDLVNAIESGEFTLLGLAADNGVGFVFNTNNRLAPEIVITADAGAPVPVPAALWLFSSGIAGLGFIRRRFMA